MKFSTTLLLITLLVFPRFFYSQTATEPTAEEKDAKLRESALVFLREAYGDVGNMRSIENRISFTAELAALLWQHDQKDAAAMFGSAVNEFKQLLAQYDGQMNALGLPEDEMSTPSYGSIMGMGEPSDRMRLSRKFRTAMAVRQQIAMSIAEHEPELAFNFYYDSVNSITNAQMKSEMSGGDTHFENKLLTEIAETNAAKASELGKRSIEKGLNWQTVGLLKKIYGKDAAKGAEFGGTILSKLKSVSKDTFQESIVTDLLEFGVETKESAASGGKKAVYTDAELREIAEILAAHVLGRDTTESYMVEHYARSIEKILPGRATQIRAKFRSAGGSESDGSATNAYRISGAPVITSAYGIGSASNVSAGDAPRQAAREAARKEQEKLDKELAAGVKQASQKDLPKEEREKIVSRAREILMKTPGREKKLMGISMLAAQVRQAGDKELASELMRDAAALVNANPKNYQDFIFTWMLVAGYAEADPDKAFPLLEDSIMRANDLINSFVRVGEFIDVQGEMIVDGEVQVGAFGGEMIRGLTREIGIAESTLKSLVRIDFEKTKAIANRVERPEVRVLAKVLVLRSALSNKKESITIDGVDSSDALGESGPPPSARSLR
jgi:hypothetical protein